MTTDLLLVSVIIPTRNCAATIERCLRSVQAQTYPNIEIIVVDNNSDDGTAQIAAECLSAAERAQVLQAGPERSAQVNYGARHARGTYLYRVDGDFELAPGVIEACVVAIERDDLDAIAVPNRSRGESYWAQVRALERDTYLGDALIVAARFWKRSAFEAVGGFDESLVACEDYDLHNRLLEQGYRVGRTVPAEIHLGEADNLWANAAQSFYYGPSILRYLRKHPHRGARQMFPLRAAYVRHWQTLVRHPHLLLGLAVLKAVQYTAAMAGILAWSLGLASKQGWLMPNAMTGLVLVLIELWGLVSLLPHYGVPMGTTGSVVVFATGIALWQITGRRRARRRRQPLPNVLPVIALAFSPLLATLVVGTPAEGGVTQTLWWFLSSLALASCAAWFVYLAELALDGRIGRVGPTILVVAGVVGFVVVFSARSLALLRTFSLDAYDLALYDQALWVSARGQDDVTFPSNLLYTSLYGRSIFAKDATPVLLLFLPVYAAGALHSLNIGGPALLLISQSIATALAAIALHRLAMDEIGRLPAALVSVAYLVYFVTLRTNAGNFDPMAFAAPLILFALDAYQRHRYAVYYVLVPLALACGLDAGMAVATLGLYLVLFRQSRQHGIVTLGLGLGWTLIGMRTFIPFFGGTAGQVLAPYAPPEGVPFLAHVTHSVFRPDALRYVGSLLAPLGFTPVLGAPLLLPALPRLLLNLLAQVPRYTSLYGWYESTITPFLFVAAIRGVHWVGTVAKSRGWASPHLAGSVLILIGCLTTTVFLAPFVIRDFQDLRVTTHHRYGHEILEQIPENASAAVQSPFAVPLAHRQRLTVLPQEEDAEFILFDAFHPNRGPMIGPQPETYQATLERAFYNPAYGLRTAVNGYLLFERGLDPGHDLARLALATKSEIKYARTVELAATVAYLGFDLSTTCVRPGEVFYITHYWESLAPMEMPYLLFTAYPGAYRFEEAAFGLFPVSEWQPGDIVRHEQAVTLPELPEGYEYEIVVGLWYDEGEPSLRSDEQLLGNNVVHIAMINVEGDHYDIVPWGSSAATEGTQ